MIGGRPRKYWNDLKKKLIAEDYVEVSEKIGQLKLPVPNGKLRETDCAETETIFRKSLTDELQSILPPMKSN